MQILFYFIIAFLTLVFILFLKLQNQQITTETTGYWVHY